MLYIPQLPSNFYRLAAKTRHAATRFTHPPLPTDVWTEPEYRHDSRQATDGARCPDTTSVNFPV